MALVFFAQVKGFIWIITTTSMMIIIIILIIIRYEKSTSVLFRDDEQRALSLATFCVSRSWLERRSLIQHSPDISYLLSSARVYLESS